MRSPALLSQATHGSRLPHAPYTVTVHPLSNDPYCDLPRKPAPVRYSHGTREGRLTVAPFRAWRGSVILVAWGPTFNAAPRGSFNTDRPWNGNSTPLKRIAGYRAPLTPRLARPRRDSWRRGRDLNPRHRGLPRARHFQCR